MDTEKSNAELREKIVESSQYLVEGATMAADQITCGGQFVDTIHGVQVAMEALGHISFLLGQIAGPSREEEMAYYSIQYAMKDMADRWYTGVDWEGEFTEEQVDQFLFPIFSGQSMQRRRPAATADVVNERSTPYEQPYAKLFPYGYSVSDRDADECILSHICNDCREKKVKEGGTCGE